MKSDLDNRAPFGRNRRYKNDPPPSAGHGMCEDRVPIHALAEATKDGQGVKITRASGAIESAVANDVCTSVPDPMSPALHPEGGIAKRAKHDENNMSTGHTTNIMSSTHDQSTREDNVNHAPESGDPATGPFLLDRKEYDSFREWKKDRLKTKAHRILDRWHRRLFHLDDARLLQMVREGKIPDVTEAQAKGWAGTSDCEACKFGKMSANPTASPALEVEAK